MHERKSAGIKPNCLSWADGGLGGEGNPVALAMARKLIINYTP